MCILDISLSIRLSPLVPFQPMSFHALVWQWVLRWSSPVLGFIYLFFLSALQLTKNQLSQMSIHTFVYDQSSPIFNPPQTCFVPVAVFKWTLSCLLSEHFSRLIITTFIVRGMSVPDISPEVNPEYILWCQQKTVSYGKLKWNHLVTRILWRDSLSVVCVVTPLPAVLGNVFDEKLRVPRREFVYSCHRLYDEMER